MWNATMLRLDQHFAFWGSVYRFAAALFGWGISLEKGKISKITLALLSWLETRYSETLPRTSGKPCCAKANTYCKDKGCISGLKVLIPPVCGELQCLCLLFMRASGNKTSLASQIRHLVFCHTLSHSDCTQPQLYKSNLGHLSSSGSAAQAEGWALS